MCIWKSDYFSICGHQPLYLHTTCPRRNLVHDSYTNRNIVRACSKIEISSIASVNAHCPDCLPDSYHPLVPRRGVSYGGGQIRQMGRGETVRRGVSMGVQHAVQQQQQGYASGAQHQMQRMQHHQNQQTPHQHQNHQNHQHHRHQHQHHHQHHHQHQHHHHQTHQHQHNQQIQPPPPHRQNSFQFPPMSRQSSYNSLQPPTPFRQASSSAASSNGHYETEERDAYFARLERQGVIGGRISGAGERREWAGTVDEELAMAMAIEGASPRKRERRMRGV